MNLTRLITFVLLLGLGVLGFSDELGPNYASSASEIMSFLDEKGSDEFLVCESCPFRVRGWSGPKNSLPSTSGSLREFRIQYYTDRIHCADWEHFRGPIEDQTARVRLYRRNFKIYLDIQSNNLMSTCSLIRNYFSCPMRVRTNICPAEHQPSAEVRGRSQHWPRLMIRGGFSARYKKVYLWFKTVKGSSASSSGWIWHGDVYMIGW